MSWQIANVATEEKARSAERWRLAPTIYFACVAATRAMHFDTSAKWWLDLDHVRASGGPTITAYHHERTDKYFLLLEFSSAAFGDDLRRIREYVQRVIISSINATTGHSLLCAKLAVGQQPLNLHPLANSAWVPLETSPLGEWEFPRNSGGVLVQNSIHSVVLSIPVPRSHRLAVVITRSPPNFFSGDVVRILESELETSTNCTRSVAAYAVTPNVRLHASLLLPDYPGLGPVGEADAAAHTQHRVARLTWANLELLDATVAPPSSRVANCPNVSCSARATNAPASTLSLLYGHARSRYPVTIDTLLERADGPSSSYRFLPPDGSKFSPPIRWREYLEHAGISVVPTGTQVRANGGRGWKLRAYCFSESETWETGACTGLTPMDKFRSKKNNVLRAPYFVGCSRFGTLLVKDSIGICIEKVPKFVKGITIGLGGLVSQRCLQGDDSCTVLQSVFAAGLCLFAETLCAVRLKLFEAMPQHEKEGVFYPWRQHDETRTPWMLVYYKESAAGPRPVNLVQDVVPAHASKWLRWEGIAHPGLYRGLLHSDVDVDNVSRKRLMVLGNPEVETGKKNKKVIDEAPT